MAWEYLPKLDKRLKIIADYLKGKTAGKTIIDLDCLEARLLKYLEPDFEKYLGNDILNKFPEHPKAEFSQVPDDEFIKSINKCDILCALGCGGYEITGEELESKTLTDSIKQVIEKHKPQIVILESVWEFETIIANIIKEGYRLVKYKKLNLGEKWVEKRVIYIYEREPNLAIIVGTRTKYDYLKQTLDYLFKNTDNSKFYLIGINNVPNKSIGKKTEIVFKKYLRPQDVYIKNNPEVGVYDFWNQGIKEALSNPNVEYVGIFNDDILLPPRWLEIILDLFTLHPSIYYLSPSWTNGIQVPVDWETINQNAIKQPLEVIQDNSPAGFCFICPRKCFEEIGFFDTQFKIWSGDTDFYYRLCEKGYYSFRTPNIVIHHFYSRTLNEMRKKPSVERILKEDRRKLGEKHHISINLNLPPLKES